MYFIQAVAFDLFNTLLTVNSETLKEAHSLLLRSLRDSGVPLEEEDFRRDYRDAALRFMEEAHRSLQETHNRLWISAALGNQGLVLSPDDPIISRAVEAYFSAFYPRIRLVPGTLEMLERLRRNGYRLGLLSNFTHGPAARNILAETGLRPFFDVILISGEMGYRKPSPIVFQELVEQMGLEAGRILYVGDDPEPDIAGALGAGLTPVWTSYVKDHHVPHTPGILSGGDTQPDQGTLRISTWEDLFRILGLGT